MKKKLKNSKMVEMLHQLSGILPHKDKIGYVAARNYRILSESLTEYDAIRCSLMEKYGEEAEDDQGVPITRIKIGSPQFKAFCDEMQPFNEMEHEVELMSAKYTDAIDCLTGEEILRVDWMFED